MRKHFILLILVSFFIIPILCSCKNEEKEYTFIYYSNSEENIASETILESKLETKELPEAEKEGYTFEGWYLDETLETPYASNGILGNKIVYLYAKYSINEYRLTLHNEQSLQEISFKYNEKIELPQLEKEDFIVKGLYIDSKYEVPYEYVTMPSKDIDVYVKWEALPEDEYIFIYYSNSEKNIASEAVLESELETKELPESEKEGYTFIGWYLDETLEIPYASKSVLGNKIVYLYAKYSINEYRLTLHNEDSLQELSFKYNEKIELPLLEKEEYIVEGLYIDSKYEISYDYVTMPSKDIDVYVKWEALPEDEYIFVYYSNSEKNIASETILESELETKELPEAEKEGYTFEGWYLDEALEIPYDSKSILGNKIVYLYAKYSINDFQVNISMNIPGSVTIYGNSNQMVSKEVAFEEVFIEENLGYRFLYYVIDDEKYASNLINLTAVQSDLEILIVSDYYTFELPIININTFGNSIDSKINYTDMTFTISNSSSDLSDITGGIRLRGNSTRSLPKKPYRIKFDKKQSLFGLTKAKSWVLLAEYLDPSGLHNYAALSLGGEMDGLSFTPTPNKVNVYLNGEYVGLYTLCEQVQENEGRIDIEIDITEDMTHLKDYNFFISMDASVVSDEDSVLNETYYYIQEYDQYFELKYPEKEDFLSEEQFLNFMTELKAYTKYLLDIFNERDVETIKNEVNLYSLADFLIIDEIMGETDHKYKSFNMYYTNTSSEEENGKMNFGPIWDYDFCLYSPWTFEPNESFEKEQMLTIFYSNDFYKAMIDIPEFLEIVKYRYTTKASNALAKMIEDLEIYQFSILDSILLNEEKWYSDKKGISIKNILYFNDFLRTRKVLLDTLWEIEI